MSDLNLPHDDQHELENAYCQALELLQRDGEAELEELLKDLPPRLQARIQQMLEDYRVLSRTLDGERSVFGKGSRFGDFLLVEKLGSGGTATVWEAEQLSLRKRVALKILHPNLTFHPTALARFAREARASGSLAHPGIAATYSFGQCEGIHFIAQEFVPGGRTLATVIARLESGVPPPRNFHRKLAHCIRRVAGALHYAHECGIVHRDVKPSNVLLSKEYGPKVSDFGMAQIEEDLRLSRTGETCGTVYYMSPEQVLSKRKSLDRRTDVFSLGVSLYEALTLRRPFLGRSAVAIVESIAWQEPPHPRSLSPEVPEELAAICIRMLAKRPGDRFQDMQSVADDLGRYLRNEPIRTRRPGPLQRATMWSRRHRTAAAAAVSALVSSTVAVSVLLVALSEPHPGPDAKVAEQPLAPAAAPRPARPLAAPIQDVSSAEPSRTAPEVGPAKAAPPEPPPPSVRPSDAEISRALEKIERRHRDVTGYDLSPDGTRVVTGHEDGRVRIWIVRDAERPVVDRLVHDGPVVQVEFAPGGREIHTLGEDATLVCSAATTAEIHWKMPVTEDGTQNGPLPEAAGMHRAQLDCEEGWVAVWLENGAYQSFDRSQGKRLDLQLRRKRPKYRTLQQIRKHDRLFQEKFGKLAVAALREDGAVVAAACRNHTIQLRWVDSGDLIAILEGHSEGLFDLGFAADGRWLVSSSRDGTVRIWDPEAAVLLRTVPAFLRDVEPFLHYLEEHGLP